MPDRRSRPERPKVPRSQGGGNHLENLVLACFGCNQRKGVKSVREFLSLFPAVEMPLRSFADLRRFCEVCDGEG